jgi:hypothetical protein
MTMRFVTLPPAGIGRSERMKMVADGNHTFEEKLLMIMKGFSTLEHSRGIFRAGPLDLWIGPLDEHNCPVSHFGNGQPIARQKLIIDDPWSCAADIYNCR